MNEYKARESSLAFRSVLKTERVLFSHFQFFDCFFFLNRHPVFEILEISLLTLPIIVLLSPLDLEATEH